MLAQIVSYVYFSKIEISFWLENIANDAIWVCVQLMSIKGHNTYKGEMQTQIVSYALFILIEILLWLEELAYDSIWVNMIVFELIL